MTTTSTMSLGAASGPTWAYRGLRPRIVLIWLPLYYSLLIAPVDDTMSRHPLSAWVAAAIAAGTFTGAVLTRFRPGPRQQQMALLLLAVLAALAVTTTAVYSSAWSSLFVLLAIGVGVVVSARDAPYVVLLITAVATVGTPFAGDSADGALTTGLTVLLSGLGTYAFHQLFAVVAELRCTREELARVAVSEERERFARDLHDLLGHTLSVMVVKAEAVGALRRATVLRLPRTPLTSRASGARRWPTCVAPRAATAAPVWSGNSPGHTPRSTQPGSP